MTKSENSSSDGVGSTQTGTGSGQKRWRGGKRRRRRSKPSPDFIPEIEGPTETVRGVLELRKDGTGWLRQAKNNYLEAAEPDRDVFVPPGVNRTHALQEGSEIVGQAGTPNRGAQRLTLATVESVDGLDPDEAKARTPFKDLTVIDPQPMMVLEPEDGDVSLRIVDLLCPIGRGQRGLIVAPPRSGKTVLMQKICNAIASRYPDVHVIVLLVDERPEEATGWRRSVKGENHEVLVSTLDEGPRNHIRVGEMALKRALRLVEVGTDVVILLDSITRLTRAYNSDMGGRGGHTMSGGIGAKVIEFPKKFFGSARKCEEGGSLTILATTLVDTGSPHGPGDLRGVQRYREHGTGAQPSAGRAPHLPGHRHRALRHPQGGAPGGGGDRAASLYPAACPGADAAARCHAPAHRSFDENR